MGQNGPLDLGLEILPTGLGSKVGQNGPFYLCLSISNFCCNIITKSIEEPINGK